MKTKILKYLLIIFILDLLVNITWSQDIPHVNMPMECDQCHGTQDWYNVSFDHSKTDFPLEGQHHDVACISCHDLEDFSRVETTCKHCHLDVHQGKLTYPCEQCHTPDGWQVLDIYMIHANTTFPILGAHSRLDCESCHQSAIVGEYSRIESNCYNCHSQEYKSTKDPVHTDFGFGHRCEDCHSMLAWQPGMFADHESRFPISSGAHAGAWESCSICHTNPQDYQVFSCLNCHEHNQNDTVRNHSGNPNFVYDSNACYDCHANGKKE